VKSCSAVDFEKCTWPPRPESSEGKEKEKNREGKRDYTIALSREGGRKRADD